MSGNDGGQQYSSFEQLMAQRYPQPATGGRAAASSANIVPPAPVALPPKAVILPSTSTTAASSTTKKSSTVKKDNRSNPGPSGLQYNTPQQRKHLNKCEWNDKILWASRLILGGNSINGFMRAAATAQRIKKQRARQSSSARKAAVAAGGGADKAAATTADGAPAPKDRNKAIFDPVEEEKLKTEIMNPRTARKIKSELEAGLTYLSCVHNLLRGCIFDIDPEQQSFLPPPLIVKEPVVPPPPVLTHLKLNTPIAAVQRRTEAAIPWAVIKSNVQGGPAQFRAQQNQQLKQQQLLQSKQQATHKPVMPPGTPNGSTFRKNRKKKLPPNKEHVPFVPEIDTSGRRTCTKKEQQFRIFEALRFRPLQQGDFVAARTTSRDLWILAKVLKDFGGHGMSPLDFLQLSEARRDAVFREKVLVKDVEDNADGRSSQVARSLVLPLPRTFSEAAEWGTRVKKGSRVYAMYPQTTSLYAATVIDSTTYCRAEDDIMVVEFDGEEQDLSGNFPHYHIPARFVTLIPREFPAANPPASSSSNKRKSGASGKKQNSMGDDIFTMDFGGGNFDALDLDFDKPLEGEAELDFNF